MLNGEAIRAARLRAGYKTQQELADVIGCARNTINRAELGRGGPVLLQRLSQTLHVPIESLMDIPTQTGAVIPANEEEEMLLLALRKLDPVLRAKAIGYVQGLAERNAETGQ